LTASEPNVSVVIPTHNRRALLEMTLKTVLWQQGVTLEAIVVDDGSTDDTAERIIELGDRRVELVRHDAPLGVSAARNSGIDVARGRWIAFLDDDDLWAPNKLSAQLDAASAAGATWVYSGCVKIDTHQRIIGGAPPPAPQALMATLRSMNPVPGGCSGVVVARRALRDVGAFDPELSNLADWDLWIRLGEMGAPAGVLAPLVAYRLHGGQASLDVDLIVREVELVTRKRGVSLDRGQFHYYLAHKCLLGGRRRDAMKHFSLAALHGEVQPVASVLWSMLRTSLNSRFPSLGLTARESDSGWLGEASIWLRDLAALSEETPTSDTPRSTPPSSSAPDRPRG
jgi:glycosyltransferase involved in cell wall biosynthesis